MEKKWFLNSCSLFPSGHKCPIQKPDAIHWQMPDCGFALQMPFSILVLPDALSVQTQQKLFIRRYFFWNLRKLAESHRLPFGFLFQMLFSCALCVLLFWLGVCRQKGNEKDLVQLSTGFTASDLEGIKNRNACVILCLLWCDKSSASKNT